MTQQELTKIWDTLASGGKVEGWGHVDNGDSHVVFPLNEHRSWERTAPDGEWVESAGMNGPRA